MAEVTFWFEHAGISVPDLDAAISWYGTVLGFEVQDRKFIPAIPAEVVFMTNGGLTLEIFCPPSVKPTPKYRKEPNEDLKVAGNKHVAFAVSDLSALEETLRSRRADIVWSRTIDATKVMFVRDVFGNLLEFIEREPPQSQVGVVRTEGLADGVSPG